MSPVNLVAGSSTAGETNILCADLTGNTASSTGAALLPNKEIAARLGISMNTVRRHIMAIYDTLHVSTRLDAVGKLGRIQP